MASISKLTLLIPTIINVTMFALILFSGIKNIFNTFEAPINTQNIRIYKFIMVDYNCCNYSYKFYLKARPYPVVAQLYKNLNIKPINVNDLNICCKNAL